MKLSIFFSLKNIKLGACFLFLAFFWNFQFLKHFIAKIMPILQSPAAKHMLIDYFFFENVLFTTPFDAEVAEKFLKGI